MIDHYALYQFDAPQWIRTLAARYTIRETPAAYHFTCLDCQAQTEIPRPQFDFPACLNLTGHALEHSRHAS